MTERVTGNAQPGARVDVFPWCRAMLSTVNRGAFRLDSQSLKEDLKRPLITREQIFPGKFVGKTNIKEITLI